MSFTKSGESLHSKLIAPYGNELVNLMVQKEDRDKVRQRATKKLECSHRNACDIELLIVGGFSPLKGFMIKADYESVVKTNRTSSGKLFGLPIVLDTDREDFTVGDYVLLTYQRQDLGVLKIEEKWEPDKTLEAK